VRNVPRKGLDGNLIDLICARACVHVISAAGNPSPTGASLDALEIAGVPGLVAAVRVT
jgi:hypothetical protein